MLIDDLDRCEPEAAYKLLEGIKIYLNLPSCVFVLGMNQRIIEGAIAKLQGQKEAGPEAQQRARDYAREYVEKICQNIYHLPLVRDPSALVETWLGNLETRANLCAVLKRYACLPANPRKIRRTPTCCGASPTRPSTSRRSPIPKRTRATRRSSWRRRTSTSSTPRSIG